MAEQRQVTRGMALIDYGFVALGTASILGAIADDSNVFPAVLAVVWLLVAIFFVAVQVWLLRQG